MWSFLFFLCSIKWFLVLKGKNPIKYKWNAPCISSRSYSFTYITSVTYLTIVCFYKISVFILSILLATSQWNKITMKYKCELIHMILFIKNNLIYDSYIYIYQKKEQTIFPIVSSVNNPPIIFDKVINHKNFIISKSQKCQLLN